MVKCRRSCRQQSCRVCLRRHCSTHCSSRRSSWQRSSANRVSERPTCSSLLVSASAMACSAAQGCACLRVDPIASLEAAISIIAGGGAVLQRYFLQLIHRGPLQLLLCTPCSEVHFRYLFGWKHFPAEQLLHTRASAHGYDPPDINNRQVRCLPVLLAVEIGALSMACSRFRTALLGGSIV